MSPTSDDRALIGYVLGELDADACARLEVEIAASAELRRRVALYREVVLTARAEPLESAGTPAHVLDELLAAQASGAGPRDVGTSGVGSSVRTRRPARDAARRLLPGAATVAIVALLTFGVSRPPDARGPHAPWAEGSAPSDALLVASVAAAPRVPVIPFRTTTGIDAHLVAWDSVAVRAFTGDTVGR